MNDETKATKKTPKKSGKSAKRKVKKNDLPKIDLASWQTSDEDEVIRRKLRAQNESFSYENLNKSAGVFSEFSVISDDDKNYLVEIRSLTENINSCNCIDYRNNGLGTCKHIEFVLNSLQKNGVRAFKVAAKSGSSKIEIFLDTRVSPDNQLQLAVKINYPNTINRLDYSVIDRFFSLKGQLIGDVADSYPKLLQAIKEQSEAWQDILRVSQHISYYYDYQLKQRRQEQAYLDFIADNNAHKIPPVPLKAQLYPYQQQGMLHLAFNERALLADEMGLGKTIQAIAAAELLRQLRGIKRVLIVTTASLKTEWEEQIARFTDSNISLVFGSRTKRLQSYRSNADYYLMNYEQVVADYAEINRILAPDVVILDEAQRIKNWQTKTAMRIKRLDSRYAFVLTGTPVENRVDDIYSLVQFLDPYLLGSLFRFNRDFYQFDEMGKPSGYKNLNLLYQRLRPIMLCRKKSDVEHELPRKTVNNFFVAMEREQKIRYDDLDYQVTLLMARAKKRALTKEEMDKLQRLLACMRMTCDTPYILDPECKTAPKIAELIPILENLLAEENRKIIIFSEWTRMLELVQEAIAEYGWGFALHTGSIEQRKRREEINRFKNDSECRLFLSSDSGSVGLNLQVADVVINLDLPWNPAKLEQRIARAWRKHQTKPVQVINLVCANSIEQRMLSLLEQKKAVAHGILTGDEEFSSVNMPSGRAAFMERISSLMENPADNESLAADSGDNLVESEMVIANDDGYHEIVDLSSEEVVTKVIDHTKESLVNNWGNKLNQIDVYNNAGKPVVFAVVDDATPIVATAEVNELVTLEQVDANTFATIQRLIAAGVLSLNTPIDTLYARDSVESKLRLSERSLQLADGHLGKIGYYQKMAGVLMSGGFSNEALPSLQNAVVHAVHALAYLRGEINDDYSEISASLVSDLVAADRDYGELSALYRELHNSELITRPESFVEVAARIETLTGKLVETRDSY